jgi:hypothetical protein
MEEVMSGSTRRGFVRNSIAAAAGVTALGTLSTEVAQAQAQPDPEAGPVIAHVRNARTGEISVMAGERTVTVQDRQLAASIARAAR